MTREQKDFIISLEVRNYNYEIEGDKIVVLIIFQTVFK